MEISLENLYVDTGAERVKDSKCLRNSRDRFNMFKGCVLFEWSPFKES